MDQAEVSNQSVDYKYPTSHEKTHLLRGRSFQNIERTPSTGTSGRRPSAGGYEELFKDTVPCPSCRGLGRVPKEQEGQLVALIPMKDKRLKPRRTVLYVVITTSICVLIAGLCMFFLFPRDVVVTSDRPLLEPIYLNLNISAYFVNFTVMNVYNFSNNNFYPVKITGAQMVSFYDEKVISSSTNKTEVNIPMKSAVTYGIAMTFFLSSTNDWGFLVKFCEDSRSWVHNLPITFESGSLTHSPTPNLENQELHFVWSLTLNLSGMEGPTRSIKLQPA